MIEIVDAYTRSGNEWCTCCQKETNTKRIKFSQDGSQGISVVLCEDCIRELAQTINAIPLNKIIQAKAKIDAQCGNKGLDDYDYCSGLIFARNVLDKLIAENDTHLDKHCANERNSSCNNNKNISQYRIRTFMHSRIVDETKITDEGYVDEIITGEEGLEEFAKTRNISIVERDDNGHIIRCSQKEHTASGGFEGCFFEFVPEKIPSYNPFS